MGAAEDVVIDRSQVMARRFALVEEIAILEGKHKAELEPLNEELVLCEKYIHMTMAEAKEQQLKIENGDMAFFTPQDSVKVTDMSGVISTILKAAPAPEGYTPEAWESVCGYIQAHGHWTLLNNAANKTAVKEFIELNKAPPPGVAYESRKVLAWRRGKA